jgi:hypothetical protein
MDEFNLTMIEQPLQWDDCLRKATTGNRAGRTAPEGSTKP